MTSPIYCGYRFPVDVIYCAIWLYLRFTLSYRDVEELLAERGIVVSYETIRRWVTTFGPQIAGRLRARRPVPHRRWHLDEMFVRIGGKQMYLWRAVDGEGRGSQGARPSPPRPSSGGEADAHTPQNAR